MVKPTKTPVRNTPSRNSTTPSKISLQSSSSALRTWAFLGVLERPALLRTFLTPPAAKLDAYAVVFDHRANRTGIVRTCDLQRVRYFTEGCSRRR